MKKLIVLFLIVCTFASASMTFVNKQWQGATEMETYLEKLGYEVDYIVAVEGLPGSYIVLSKAGGTDGTLDIATLTVDEGFTQTAVSRTAGTAITSADAIIAAGTSMVIVTNNAAAFNNFIVLPTPVAGHKLVLLPAQAVYEIRPDVTANYINGTQCSSGEELLVPTGSIMTAVAISTTNWIITQQDEDGTTDAGGIPD